MAGVASTLAKKRALAAGFGTNANASKYLNQDFQSLRSECLRKGSIFTDCTFPAAPESLGFKELGPNTSKTRGVQWKRPGELVSNPEFIVGGATRTDICQGGLGKSTFTLGGLGKSTFTLGGLGKSTFTLGGLGKSTFTLGGLGKSTFTLGGLGKSTFTLGGLCKSTFTLGGLGKSTFTIGTKTGTIPKPQGRFANSVHVFIFEEEMV
ncbi:unnamed protein product [Oncorhynchus mykiss]|uniref:Calpain catalytic domain-containing protein n=1 Tax=Oncorhynchus mykiss TaxID=8022 RepID=A0A060Y8Y1_ONCMY|nr:unnamed protein product [Oncorhynchus mykiss]